MSKSKFPKLHKVQWQILKKMATQEHFRFNELKPKEMDPRRFVYHLDRLKAFGLILHDKDSGKYWLADGGKMVIAHYEDLPSIEDYVVQTYLLLYIKRKGELLAVKRKHAPYLGFVGNPFVNMVSDEYIRHSAGSALSELGLEGQLSLNLILEMIYKRKDKSVRTHAFIYIFYTENPKGEPKKNNEEGTLSWLTPEELLKSEEYYDNTKDIIEFFESKGFDKNSFKMISKSYSTPW
ncbi:MAG: hypothetical protein ABIE03_05050 [Patescibacteria group bacterium]|nr:hypothetical protein [Patescibacteria group bacterium]